MALTPIFTLPDCNMSHFSLKSHYFYKSLSFSFPFFLLQPFKSAQIHPRTITVSFFSRWNGHGLDHAEAAGITSNRAQTGKCVFAPLQEPLKQTMTPPSKKKTKKKHHLFTLTIIHMETHIRESDCTSCAIVMLEGGSKKEVFFWTNKADGNTMLMKLPITPFTCLIHSAKDFKHLCFQCQKAQMLCCYCIIWALKPPLDTVSLIRSLIIQLVRVCQNWATKLSRESHTPPLLSLYDCAAPFLFFFSSL